MAEKRYKAVFNIDCAWDVNYQLHVNAKNQTEARKQIRASVPGAFNIQLIEKSKEESCEK